MNSLMKKTCLQFLTFGILGAACQVMAHDVIAPCWRGSDGSTFQEWSFFSNANPASPGAVSNPYGSPSATITVGPFGDGYRTTFGTSTNVGFWDLGSNGVISVQVPNRPGAPSASSKYIWVQVAHMIGGPLGYATISIPGASYLGGQKVLVEAFGLNGDSIYVDQTMWRLEPNPSTETITITAPNGGALINQVVVDTLCITNSNTYVDDDYSDPDCTLVSWPAFGAPADKPIGLLAFPDIQTAVDRTPTNGTVNVADGSYLALSVSKPLTVHLDSAPAVATLFGNLTLGATATLSMDVSNQIVSANFPGGGNVTLGGALNLTCNVTVPLGTTFTLLDKQKTGAISGTFSGLPQGATNNVGGQQFVISYVGGNGNDVVLTMVNHAPIPGPKIAQTDQDTSASIAVIKLLINATDPDLGDVVSFGSPISLSASNGTVVADTLEGQPAVTYTPPSGFTGTDYFYYTITDGKAFSTGTVTVTVRPANAITFNMLPLIISNSLPLVRFAGSPTNTYTLQRSTDMVNWDFSVSVATGTNGIGTYYDVGAPTTNGYYRTRYP